MKEQLKKLGRPYSGKLPKNLPVIVKIDKDMHESLNKIASEFDSRSSAIRNLLILGMKEKDKKRNEKHKVV